MGGGSISELRLADHMINSIYPIVNDKHVLINAVSHLAKALQEAVIGFMKRHTDYAKATQLPAESVVLDEFLSHYASKLGVGSYRQMLTDISKFNSFINKASIRLKKNDKLILISPEYSMVSISMTMVKQYLIKAQEFIKKVNV